MVVVRAIPFASISSTNLFPFFGSLHIAYTPTAGVVLGLSKFARIARCLAARIQLQSALTLDLLTELHTILQCAGAAVVVEASHVVGSGAPVQCISAAACGMFTGPKTCSLEQLLTCHLPTLPGDATARILAAAADVAAPDPTLLYSTCDAATTPTPEPPLAAMVAVVQRLLSLLPAPLPPPTAARAYCAQLAALTRGYRAPAVALVPSSAPRESMQRWTVPFTSLCEHHMLPFCGRVCIAAADAPRVEHMTALVHRRALRLQVQERLTQELADDLAAFGTGVAVWVEAQHLCMVGRGVETPCVTQTSACRGGGVELLRVAAAAASCD